MSPRRLVVDPPFEPDTPAGDTCPTCGSPCGTPPGAAVPAGGQRGAFTDAEGAARYWRWRCPLCRAGGCAACAGGHACTRSFPLCFAHRLPMELLQCWCCREQSSGLVCPACVGGACAHCWRSACRPGAPLCGRRSKSKR